MPRWGWRECCSRRPRPVLADRALRRAGQLDRRGDAVQIAAHPRQVAGLDRHVSAGADRDAEVGLDERGRVVDAVADHRDRAAVGLEAGDLVLLAVGQHLREDAVDSDLAAMAAAVRWLSPVIMAVSMPMACSRATAVAAVQPERARAGDDQHADGGCEAVDRPAECHHHTPKVTRAIRSTAGTNTAETRAARRWAAPLPDCARSTIVTIRGGVSALV